MQNAQQIAEVLSKYRHCPANMTGANAASDRQRIMQLLTGKRSPKSACGVNAVRLMLYNRIGVQGECIAQREAAVAEWSKANLAMVAA